MKEETEIVGGWTIIRGEPRFIPLKPKRIPHCTSCLFFNRKYETCSHGHYCYPDTPACPEYVNKTHGRKDFKWLAGMHPAEYPPLLASQLTASGQPKQGKRVSNRKSVLEINKPFPKR
jgi:hypothetical protein